MKKRLIRIIIGAILFATAIFLPESPAYLGLIGFLTNIVKRDNALVDANHIRRHAHAAILVRGQRVQ